MGTRNCPDFCFYCEIKEKILEIESKLKELRNGESKNINKVSQEDFDKAHKEFEEKDIKTINFDEFLGEKTTEIYNALSTQVKSVGATKIMHLRVPQVFVLWDTRIREYYGFKDDSAESYTKFLGKMRNNYMRITKPLMDFPKVSN